MRRYLIFILLLICGYVSAIDYTIGSVNYNTTAKEYSQILKNTYKFSQVYQSKKQHAYILSGTYFDKPCDIYVYGDMETDSLTFVSIWYDEIDTWKHLRGAYINMFNTLKNIYGDPFTNYAIPDEKKSMIKDIKLKNITIGACWHYESYTVELIIEPNCRVRIGYRIM